MKKSFIPIIFVALISTVSIPTMQAFGGAQPTSGQIVLCNTNLDGPQHVPPTGSGGTGSATIDLDTNTGLLDWNIAFSGLSGPATAIHMHGPAPPGINNMVQVNVGNLTSPSIGSTNINAGQQADLLAGLWYINIHTQSFPAGEIRGQINCEIKVAGELLPLDNTALFIAGFSSVAIWMIPVITTAGAGLYLVGNSCNRRNLKVLFGYYLDRLRKTD